MTKVVCRTEDLAPGEMISTSLGPVPVVVIRARSGALSAMTDKCLHHGGPLSRGAVLARLVSDEVGAYNVDPDEREVVRCPWHGYEYDTATGCMALDESRCIRRFDVREENGHIVLAG